MSNVSHVRGALRGLPLSKQHVFIATPTYTGKLDASYLHSLLYSMRRLEDAGIQYDHYVLSHNCHVDDSRNAILRDFLQTECTDLVFIDADVSWEPEALVKLIQHDRDIVAGVYPKRSTADTEYPVHVEPGVELRADKDGLVEVTGAPTGFMKIKRHVIEKMVEANKHRRFMSRGAEPGDAPHTIVFERTYEDGHRWSGDYAFCIKWKKMGGKIYVDPEMFLSHLGEVSFSGTLGEYWKRKYGVLDMEKELGFREALEELRSGHPTNDTWVKLTHGWGNPFSAGVELLAACYDLAKNATGPILETGSGLSTIVMALANPNVEIHALEHEPIWGSALKYRLEFHGIKNVRIHYNPLAEYPAGKWYDVSEFPRDIRFSLALCDGPPRKISKRSIVFDQLGAQIEGAVVAMDDADDAEAVAPIQAWASGLGRQVKVMGRKRRFAVSAPVPAALREATA